LLGLVRLDTRRNQGDAGVTMCDQPPLCPDAVDPTGIGRAVDHFRCGEQVEHEALVRRAALDDDRRLCHRAPQPCESLVAVTAAMSCRSRDPNATGIESPSPTPVSTRTPGPAGRARTRMRPGDGAKARSGSSAFSRAATAWPISSGLSRSSRPPDATWSCSLTRSVSVVTSVTGCSTWSRVLTSRNENRRSSGWYKNSTVPAPAYPTATARRSALALSSAA